ncbi:hypothetical protein M422DRAFT_257740 [Sphaerobolus stellatus SS14]|uniref:Cytochrome b561 domain-containing protein n=1 Tax=Sphaerobolus stellatus (strain SS14) TaxID=990650 RepID=A0A0C9VNV1_SPHS4|nr:hypothetical protein M422DRAFT_257740 [Sphaerobolus stellatus SS14]
MATVVRSWRVAEYLLGVCLSMAFMANASHGHSSGGSSDSAVPTSANAPLRGFEKTIIVHGIMSTVAFLLVLPAGIYLARFTRTFNNKWYTGHWIIQGVLGGLTVVIGVGLGFLADNQVPEERESPHKDIGKVILFLYFAQCALGAFIHFVKIRFRWGRPPQNYFHAILGLLIVGLSVYQIWLGFAREWPGATGRPNLSSAYTIAWLTWSIALVVLYAGGLTLLPRQWRQERTSKNSNASTNASALPTQYAPVHLDDQAWQYRESIELKGH